ncbi:hypothetical protein M3J09_003590 [Ascochyta lentis]
MTCLCSENGPAHPIPALTPEGQVHSPLPLSRVALHVSRNGPRPTPTTTINIQQGPPLDAARSSNKTPRPACVSTPNPFCVSALPNAFVRLSPTPASLSTCLASPASSASSAITACASSTRLSIHCPCQLNPAPRCLFGNDQPSALKSTAPPPSPKHPWPLRPR